MKRVARVFVVVALLLGMSQLASAHEESSAHVRIAIGGSENNLTPFTLTMGGLPTSHDLTNLVYDTLFWSQVKEDPEPWLAEAQDDATRLAIQAQEAAGLDIITDGEIRRESYSNRFATALEGVDIDNPGEGKDRSGHPILLPRIVGKVRRRGPVEVEDLLFLKRHTKKKIKITVPGPFTMSEQAKNEFYRAGEEAAMDYAVAVNEEIRDLFAAGADIVQID